MERGKVLTKRLFSQRYQKTKLVATLKTQEVLRETSWSGQSLQCGNFKNCFWCFCQWQAISRLPKSRTYASTTFSLFRPMGMVGKACLPSNPRTPDYTRYSGVHVCWSEHSDLSLVYGYTSFDYGLVTITTTTSSFLPTPNSLALKCFIIPLLPTWIFNIQEK